MEILCCYVSPEMLMFSSVSLVTSPFVPMCVRFGYPWRLSKTNFVRSNTYEKHGLVLFWASYHIMSLRPRVAYGSLKARGSSFSIFFLRTDIFSAYHYTMPYYAPLSDLSETWKQMEQASSTALVSWTSSCLPLLPAAERRWGLFFGGWHAHGAWHGQNHMENEDFC